MKGIFDTDERVFTIADLFRFFRAEGKRWARLACIGACAAFFFYALSAPKYRIEATFKEGMEKSGGESSIKDLLGGINSTTQQPQAVVLMKSNQVLKPLSGRLGLQASIVQSRSLIGKVFCRVVDNLQIETGKGLKDPDPFLFRRVSYEGEGTLSFSLRFVDAERFILFSGDRKTKITEGQRGAPTLFPEGTFTLVKTPEKIKMDHFYELKIDPWIVTVKNLRSQIKIASDKINKSIYDLNFFHRDRKLGVLILNELMAEYQNYLKTDHDLLAQEQLNYLEQRQTELYGKLSTVFDEHVSYLKNNIEKNGFVSLEHENESHVLSQQKMFNRVFEIDLEQAYLERAEREGKPFVLSLSEPYKNIFSEIQNLKQQRDLLEISLQRRLPRRSDELHSDSRLDTKICDLQEIRAQRNAVEKWIEELDQGQELSVPTVDLNQSLYLWAKRLNDSQKWDLREDLCDYLDNYSRVLSVREKMLQERFFHENQNPSELEGINLETAKLLFVDYNSKIDRSEALIKFYSQFREEILRKDFEIGSLSSILMDPLSQKLIDSATKIALQLKDEKYYSGKEGQRWEEELNLQRKVLSDHLAQLLKVEEMNLSLNQEKLTELQQVSLDCINQNISVLYEAANSEIKGRRNALLKEKAVLAKKMEEMKKNTMDLPEKWRLEKWLELKTEMGQKMMETLTQLVESKTIGHHLHHVESKPLDCAILPSEPEKPHLFTKAFLGAFATAFGAFFLSLFKTILKGFPVSLEKLRALQLPTLGALSSNCDGPREGAGLEPLAGSDLELLRRLHLFLEERPGKIVGLIAGAGPDYSYALGENLGRMASRSIILRCDFKFKFRDEDLPGLLQFWKGEIPQLPIRKENGFDTVASGGFTPFGTEVIQSQAFAKILEGLKKNYDWVFLLLRTPLADSEAMAALRLCDKAVVTVCGEQAEVLKPFADWSFQEERPRLTFVAISDHLDK